MSSVDEIKKQLFIDSEDVCGNTMVDIYEAQESCDKAYNKAIDDFVGFANTMPTVEEDDGTIRPMWLEEIAEKLKEGGENE